MNDDNGNNGQELVHQNNNQNSENTTQIPNNLGFGEEIRKMLSTAGTLDLPDDKNAILFAPVKPEEVYIKPDGLIYMTWTKYAQRLSKAVGISWTMVPDDRPKISTDAQNNHLVIWGFHLMIKGAYCGFAIGEQQYHDNKRMTFGEACEGAKSNALTRLCKALGIGIELWDKEFINDWLSKYADKKWDEQKRKFIWFLRPNAFANVKHETPPPAPVIAVAPPVQSVVSVATPQPAAESTPPVAETPIQAPEVKQTPKSGTKVNITTVSKPAPVKTETETKIETPTTLPPPVSKPKPGYTGKAKANKISENTDFLNQVPLVPIKDAELEQVNGNPVDFNSLSAEIDNSHTTGKLQMIYNGKVKEAHTAKYINDNERETLRKKANSRFVELSSQGK